MGATVTIDDPVLALVLPGTYLSTLEGWRADLAQQRKEIWRSDGMTSKGNGTWVTRMVAQGFTDYATVTFKISFTKSQKGKGGLRLETVNIV